MKNSRAGLFAFVLAALGWATCTQAADPVPLAPTLDERTAAERVADLYAEGTKAYSDKDFDLAIARYSEAIKFAPTRYELFSNRGNAYEWQGDKAKAAIDYDEAIRLLSERIIDQPDYFILYLERGRVLTNRGEYDRAIADFDTVVDLFPKNRDVIDDRLKAVKGREYLRRLQQWQDYAESIRHPKDATGFVRRAMLEVSRDNYDRALKVLDRAEQAHPESDDIILFRITIFLWRKDFENASREADRAIAGEHPSASRYLQRARIHIFRQDHAAAIADLQESIRLDPKSALAISLLAWIKATCSDGRHRDGKEALELALRACEIEKWQGSHYFSALAAAYAEAGDFAQAIKWQSHAIEVSEREANYLPASIPFDRDCLAEYQKQKPYRSNNKALFEAQTEGRLAALKASFKQLDQLLSDLK